jgi:1,4-dihydroxy-6-naphthoate synthase
MQMPFHMIPRAVKEGKVDAGLVIHEGQISFGADGLIKVLDLGRWWNDNTNGLAVPLGINVASSKTMSGLRIKEFEQLFKDSILFGLTHFDEALDYAMTYSRGQARDVIRKFIGMYVNRLTVDMGTEGIASIQRMFELALNKGILKENISILIKG